MHALAHRSSVLVKPIPFSSPAQMSLVGPTSAQSASGAKNMRQLRPSAPRNWLFLHLLVCFVLIFGFKLCLHAYLSSKVPLDYATNQSPLQELSWMETGFEGLSAEELEIYLSIADRAAMDVKFFAIPEMIYPQSDNGLLYKYVENQLILARDVLTGQQAEFVLKLIESGVAQGSMLKKEIGDKGSLRNSVVIALMKEERGNLHFAMAAVSVEPRLGWRLIRKKQRNEWNKVLSRAADIRLKQEMIGMFNTVGSMNNIHKPEGKAVEESLDDRVVKSLRELFA